MKELLNNTKFTILIGIVFPLIYIVGSLINGDLLISFLNQIYIIGFIIYFSVVLLRLRGKKINIKKAQKLLIILCCINLIIMTVWILIFSFQFEFHISFFLIYDTYFIIVIIYLYGLFNRKYFINNKFFLIASIINAIVNLFLGIGDLLYIIMQLSFVPYFYNYYNIEKGCEKNEQ